MTRQQAGVSAEAVAKLVEKWRKNEDNAYRQCIYEQCAEELEQALATAPPEQAGNEQQHIAALEQQLSTVSRADAKLDEHLANGVKWQAPKPMPVVPSLPDDPRFDGAIVGAFGTYKCPICGREEPHAHPELEQDGLSMAQTISAVLNHRGQIGLDELARLCGRSLRTQCREWIEQALAAHDQKVRAEVCEAVAQVVKKWNFMACSDADGLMDAIRSLAAPAPAASKRAERKEP